MSGEKGGPAFPFENVILRERNSTIKEWRNHLGISKLAYFASDAMKGFCANPGIILSCDNLDRYVELSFAIAEKMLKKEQAK